MRKLFAIAVLFIGFVSISFSQSATLKGVVKDGNTGELLEGATVLQPPTNGTSTDIKGNYELKVTPGDITLVISYVGMKADTEHVNVKDGETKTFDVSMGSKELGEVVIGESKIAVKLQKVTQSVDIIKPRMLETNNVTNLTQAVMKLPGVTVLDGQMSVRGGSGYAYGTGSRVMLVVDEMPLMSADRGEIKWPLIPIENIEQMELIKGASTVQYGSSALNGVLNVTTAYARDTPSTHFSLFYEGVGKPPVDSFAWWKRGKGKFFENPNMLGMTFLHKQKFGDVDFIFSGMFQGLQSHLQQEYDYFIRFTNKIRWQPRNLKRLTLEVATNLMYRKSGFQFFWQDGGHPYLAGPGVDLDERYFLAFVDPKIKYVDKKGNQYKLLTRINRQNNIDGQTDFTTFRADFQFRHDFGQWVNLQCGISNDHSWVSDGTLGKHQIDFAGAFAMARFNYKWLTINGGIREELYRLDSAITPTVPVVSLGFNFQIGEDNNIRASFGQSFRVPSPAERFVTYQLAGIRILPNYSIKPERGFTAELGYKRSFRVDKWHGYFDVVAFWTEFKDMIEFKFGTKFDASGFYPYFQSQNVSKARIFGFETSLVGEGKIGKHVDMTAQFGYTYFYGVDLNDTTWGASDRNKNIGKFLGDAFTHFALPTAKDDYTWDSLTAGMLKYRNPHMFKADFDFLIYNHVRLGTSLQVYGFMTQIDKIFGVFIQGINQQRQDRRNQADVIWDLRAGYEINRNVSINFLVKNVLNTNYAIRISRPDKPRSFTVQMLVNFGGKQAKGANLPRNTNQF
jgi:iron complex outermembrane receptor protein